MNKIDQNQLFKIGRQIERRLPKGRAFFLLIFPPPGTIGKSHVISTAKAEDVLAEMQLWIDEGFVQEQEQERQALETEINKAFQKIL